MMNESPDDLMPDPRLRDALLAADRAPTLDVVALRQRVLAAAAPQLAARRLAPSWWDVTSRAARFLIPASLAAAALAILLLRQVPADRVDIAGAAATSSSLAYEVAPDSVTWQGMAADALMPSDADSWLLGDYAR